MAKNIPYRCHRIFHNAFQGESCFIVGSGVSIADLDISKIPQKAVVIAVNGGVLAFTGINRDQHNTFWTSNDTSVMKWTFWKNIMEWNCLYLLRTSFLGRVKHENNPDMYFFKCRTKETPTLEPSGLRCQSSAPSAIDQAIQFGCKNIYLLGLDHFHTKKARYFFEVDKRFGKHKCYIAGASSTAQKKSFKGAINSEYPFLQRLAQLWGANVYNCSPKSQISVFDKIDFDQAIERSI